MIGEQRLDNYRATGDEDFPTTTAAYYDENPHVRNPRPPADDGLFHLGGLSVPHEHADWLRAAIARADAVRAAREARA